MRSKFSLKNFLSDNLNSHKDILFIIFLYCLSYFPILFFTNAIFWDDWVLISADTKTIIAWFQLSGNPWVGYFHQILLNIGPEIYRLITFFSYLFSGLILRLILKKQPIINKEQINIIVILFLLLPLNIARVALISIPYSLCYLAFFLGWYLIEKNKIIASLFFIFSFSINSFLVFILIPFLAITFKESKYKLNKNSFYRTVVNNIYLLFLPVVFWTLKFIFFKPYGMYENYNNNIKLINILPAIFKQLFDVLRFFINLPLEFLFLTFLLGIIIWPLIISIFPNKVKVLKQNNNKLIYFSIISIFSAGFPYWILGYVPTIFYWSSRHQLLFPFGISLLLSIILTNLKLNYRHLVFSLIISFSLALNIFNLFEFTSDWEKQKSLISEFKNYEEIRNADLVYFRDFTKKNNAINREYRDYEWMGIMIAAYGNSSRIGVSFGEKDNKIYYYQNSIKSGCSDFDNLKDAKLSNNLKSIIVEIRENKNNQSFLNKLLIKLSIKPITYNLEIKEQPDFKISKEKLSKLAPLECIVKKVS